MLNSKDNVSRFSRSLWLALGGFVVFAASFFVYFRAEKLIDRANEERQQSILLAAELRQSSDDLTRMVRTYVVTGEPIYKQHYQEILDIRDGRKPRPRDYQNIYWDLVLPDDRRPNPPGPAVPLLDLMHQAGFTTEEFAKLAEAKANSDRLTHTEFAAMALVEGQPSDARRAQASRMLHDDAYHLAKAGIMGPISEFQRMADQRTLLAVQAAEGNATRMRLAFLLFGVLLLSLLWGLRRNLHSVLGGQVSELHERIARLGSGDFASPIPVAAGMENSVLGWLSETQIKLAQIDAQRLDAQARNQRMTMLYSALSQCNQAIVRCTGESELFSQICRDVVTFGGVSMAWIGTVNAAGRLAPVAAFGRNTEYLEGLSISLSASEPHGRGPTGTAFREDRAYWCQDFQNDPVTAPWHERGRQFSWGSSASLPLHRQGQVIGVFTLYADTANVFDDAEQSLLLEMAVDIDYALNSFEREAALAANNQRLNALVEAIPDAIYFKDGSERWLIANEPARRLFQLDGVSWQDKTEADLAALNPAFREARANWLADDEKAWQAGTLTLLSQTVMGDDGQTREFEVRKMPLFDEQGGRRALVTVGRNITEHKRAEERIRYLANFDSLTGLPNRAQLDERARYALGLAKRNNQPMAVMLLDLDHFKDINDSLGHSIGDALLVELARRLRETLRDEDTVARLGGDEFIILLHGADGRGAAHVAQKLLDVIAKRYRVEHYDLNVTGSIGIALYPTDGSDLETLSKSADAAMYRVKQEGRQGYRFFTAEMQARSSRHLQLVNALRQALEEGGQLHVHYQPQIAMADGRVVGAEALLRWNHLQLGAISPGEFIPAAEESGLILPLGEWVLRQAVRQAKAWMQGGMAPLVMAVNLSAVQFHHADLPNLVSRILDEEDLPPEYLELELTEGVAMHDPQSAIGVMNNLHERGVRMSIDDFGTGYSSLSHLKKFKVYKLKIDQSFVRDISTDPEDKAIVGAVIHMAQSLGLLTIAEGVETEGQLAFLREQGCDEIQGYYFSRPLPADQFAAFAAARALSPARGDSI